VSDQTHDDLQDAAAALGDPAPVDLSHELTGTGNAHRFLNLYRDQVRHVAGVGWYLWRDGVWRLDERDEVLHLTEAVGYQTYAAWQAAAADENTPQRVITALGNHHGRTASLRGRQEMLALSSTHPSVSRVTTQLDQDHWALRVKNGTVDLRTGELRESRREDGHTREAAVRFEPGAQCPEFQEVVASALPDPTVAGYLRRVFGYCLTGSTAEQAFFFLFGVPGASKSTLCEVLLRLLGEYGHVADDDLLYKSGHPTNVVDLLGKRLVVHDELSRTRQIDAARLNQFTGSSSIQGRRMRQDFVNVPLNCKFVLTSNLLPRIGGSGADGVWRRMKMLDFKVAVPADQRVKDYARLLVEKEGPGILNWCLLGLAEYLKLEGLVDPQVVADSVADYRDDEDVLQQFTSLCLVKTGDQGDWLANEAVIQAYEAWCKSNGHKPDDGRVVGKALRSLGYVRAKPLRARRTTADGTSESRVQRGWLGARLDIEQLGGFLPASPWVPVNPPSEAP
jgi:putative DNA primase/helicase